MKGSSAVESFPSARGVRKHSTGRKAALPISRVRLRALLGGELDCASQRLRVHSTQPLQIGQHARVFRKSEAGR